MQGKQIGRDELKPGDHIYTWRPPGLYAHHGIYVGNGNVIHFMGRPETGFFSISSSSSSFSSNQSGFPCPTCGYESGTSGVVSSCLDCFLCGGDLYLYLYGVPPAVIMFARGGTCTCVPSDPPEDVLHPANYLLDNGFGSYDLTQNNCEHFAVYCKTGLVIRKTRIVGWSGQATSFTDPFSRYVSDIGVRRDVEKIPVEEVSDFRTRREDCTIL